MKIFLIFLAVVVGCFMLHHVIRAYELPARTLWVRKWSMISYREFRGHLYRKAKGVRVLYTLTGYILWGYPLYVIEMTLLILIRYAWYKI